MDAKDRIIEQRMAKRRHSALVLRSIIALLLVLAAVLAVILIRAAIVDGAFDHVIVQVKQRLGMSVEGEDPGPILTEKQTEAADTAMAKKTLKKARKLAAQYDYQGAIDLLKKDPSYASNGEFHNEAAIFQAQKDACKAYPLDEIPHVFFHTLVKDTSKAFDGDGNEPGYNQVMTTISEFNSIIQQMYDRGYVMVSLHDMCKVNEDGTVSRREIRLPEGKKPFVLSQDDVSYYHYMVGDGFANRLVLNEKGKVKNSYIEDDGTVSIGNYDMVPLIDAFVRKHPDFSYHGHKGIIALTGYEGVLGYRTDEVYRTREESRLTEYQRAFLDANPDFDWDSEVEQAKAVAKATWSTSSVQVKGWMEGSSASFPASVP